MKTPEELLGDARKIVIKLGSNTISDKNGKVDRNIMKHIVAQIMELIDKGKRVIVVSSGAGVSGVGAINKWARKNDINYKQALCAIGQVELMNAYKEFFGEYGLHVGQILLTGEDFNEPHRELNIRNALFTLVDEGVVPIINENDSVAIEEFSIGDNDTLSALVANLWAADLLILMSDIDGVYDKDPHTYKDAKLIEWVDDIEKLRQNIKTDGKSDFGTGGIITKINAAEIVNRYGTAMMVVNSRKENILGKLAKGEEKATVFSRK
ncbi:MAG: glutamate 5-kinase [Anaerovoracaceae bacterium]|jgi:glutamate 5-kinase